jgi:Icc-related predicted phosphoesterase
MPIRSKDEPRGDVPELRVRIAATGDVHCSRDADREHWTAAFAGLRGQVDLVLLAGDLTTHGEPEQAAILADAVRDVEVPVLTVLGNHDWHANRRDEVVVALGEGGIDVLDREHRVLEVDGAEVGVVGCKGFVGGFPGSHMPDFGEPLLREVYAEGMREVAALDDGLRAIALCPFRIALLHYSPAEATLEGERRDIWAFLGTDRLAAPIREHAPDVVLHGHAHAGTFAGEIAGVPVRNVSVPVMGEDFWLFELTGDQRAPSEAH